MTLLERMRAALRRCRFDLQYSKRSKSWRLYSCGHTSYHTNLGRLCAHVLACGGSATVELTADERKTMRDVARSRSVPCLPS